MLILAIESSCDETAAAVVEMGEGVRRIRSSVVASQVDTHALYGGVVPEIASRAHIEAISGVVTGALRDAGLTMREIDAVGVTYAPGLIGSLLVGVSFAKGLAFANGKPLVPVNHIKGHAAAAYLTDETLEAPFCALIVSGGHTSLYEVGCPTSFAEIGGTRDDAAGEAFDKVGRVMGLPYPGGAAMDRLAASGFANGRGEMFHFPSPAVNDASYDYSFSGLKTAVINQIHTIRQRLNLGDDGELPEDPSRLENTVCATHITLEEGMEPLPRIGSCLAHKYCGGGHGGYALYLYETPDARAEALASCEYLYPIEPYCRTFGKDEPVPWEPIYLKRIEQQNVKKDHFK